MALSAEYFGRHVLGLPSTDEIIAICGQNGFASNGLTYPPNGTPIAYIKYGDTVIMGEMWTQRHVSNSFNQMMDASNVKAPEIYHAFQCKGQTYILMEYVNGQTVGALLRASLTDKHWIYDQVAKAVNQLLRVPVPKGSRPGPVGGGYAQHCFFRDEVAPKEYASVSDLQRHINKKKSTFLAKNYACYSDIWEENFIITEAGQVYVIDFQHAAFLQTSFMNFVLRKPTKLLIPRIAAKICLPESVNLNAMNRASYILKISSDDVR